MGLVGEAKAECDLCEGSTRRAQHLSRALDPAAKNELVGTFPNPGAEDTREAIGAEPDHGGHALERQVAAEMCLDEVADAADLEYGDLTARGLAGAVTPGLLQGEEDADQRNGERLGEQPLVCCRCKRSSRYRCLVLNPLIEGWLYESARCGLSSRSMKEHKTTRGDAACDLGRNSLA